MKTPSVHIMEGVDRLEKPPPEDTLFERGADLAALATLHHGLEYFPTPPWAVRAMVSTLETNGVIPFGAFGVNTILEPACGRGHIITPLRELGLNVHGLDIHDHGIGEPFGDFLTTPFDDDSYDAVITNPPFKLAEAFVAKGLRIAEHVIVLCRLSFLNSVGRYEMHFASPAGNLRTFMPCIERVPMVLGRYDPQASTATEFAWFHFERAYTSAATVLPIPPGSRERYQRREDVRI